MTHQSDIYSSVPVILVPLASHDQSSKEPPEMSQLKGQVSTSLSEIIKEAPARVFGLSQVMID